MVESAVQSHAKIVVDSAEKLKIRVLHVDDELDLLKVAKQCLEMQGPFQVDTASSVEEALNKLKEKEYDAVVSDFQMPGKDGLEFLEMLRKNGNNIPFIIFTGKGREEVAVKAWSLGADHYVNKTGDPETVYCELAHCLRSTVEKHFSEAQTKETVQKLQTIYQNAVEGISYVDAEENIVYANKAFADIIGYEQEQLAGMNLRKTLDDENWAKIENETKRRRQGGSSRYEVDFRRSDGTVRNVLISGAPLLDHDGRFTGTIGVVLDITEQKKAKEDIKQSEERFKGIFESVDDGLIYLDTTGRIIEINRKAVEFFGGSKEELLGKHFIKIGIFSIKEMPTLTKRFIDILRGKRTILDITIKNKKGQAIPLECSASLSKAYGKSTIAVVARDMTKHRERERLLRESEEKYRDLFENAMDAIVTLDLKGSITEVNNSVLRFGYKREDIVGKNILDFVSKEYRPAVMRDFSKVTKGESAKSEIELIVPKGKIIGEYHARAIVKENNVAGVQINIRDVTERKKTEQALHASLERYRSFIEVTEDLGWTTNANGEVLADIPSFRRFTGQTYEEVKGWGWSKALHPDDLERTTQIWKEATRTKSKYEAEYRLRRHDGAYRYFIARSVPVFNEDGSIREWVGTCIDITERKKAEETLKESEKKFRLVFEGATDGILAADAKTEKFVFANPKICEITGYREKELLRLRVEDIHPKKDLPYVADTFKKQLQRKIEIGRDIPVLRKDGDVVYCDINTYLLEVEERKLLVGLFRDVTDRKKAEKVIIESQQKFETLFNNNPEAAAHLDMDFRVLDVNPRFCKLFGYSANEAKGKHMFELVVPEDKVEEAETLYKEAKKGYAYYDTVRRRKDGSRLPVSISTAPITVEDKLSGYVIIYKDSTELKRAQEEAEESRRHFQSLFDLMADPVAVVDGRGKILEVTQKVEEITGFKKEELVGKNLLETKLFGAKTKAVMIKSLAERMLGMNVEPYEVEVLKKDGGKLMYEINASKIDHKGKPADLVVFRDILERKNLEEKLRVVGSLTRHDVRNKLSAVTGNAYLLKRKLAGNPEALEQLADMENAVRKVEAIFEFARTYEKLGVEQLVNMNVGKAVEEAASLFPDLKGIRIVNECGGLTVLADSLLRQLFYNLIDNSLKYGEKLTQIRIRYEEFENKLKLIYEDDGVGISEDDKAKIFSEGFTTGKGSGYGLYLIRRITEVYGWAISETGTHGKGAQFTINIPKAKLDGRQNYKLS